MIRYLIVDDEYIAHDIIKGYCQLLPHLELQKDCYDAIEALDYLREHTVDLIFLDLNMPKLKGFDFLRTLRQPPKIIVTTAYQEHALEGYELNITDYLLKPFSFERFLQAVNKATSSSTPPQPTYTAPAAAPDKRIFLRQNK
ncbi:MAG: response regulator, partial [Bacteroidota bacterium]